MECIKCAADIPLENAQFCPFCGASQVVKEKTGHRAKARGNGQGTAYRRGRTWTAQVVTGWKVSEDPKKAPIPIKATKGGFATRKDALAYCPQLLIGKPKEAPRLSAYWETYKSGAYKALSDSKQTAYRIAYEKRLISLQNVPVDALTVGVLQNALDASCDSYYTMKDAKSLLSNLFKIAAADGFVNKDIPSMIQLPKLEEKEREIFTDNEQKALWKTYESGNMDAAIALLMLHSGMMPGECIPLRTEQIDLENRVITGAGKKTAVRKKTPIAIADCLLPVLQDLIEHARPDGHLWIQSEDDWYSAYYAGLESAGCRRLKPYCCRHSFATRLSIDENIAPQTIKRVMRWSTSRMLDRYSHPDTQDALDAVNRLRKN